ncbi:sensor histidine kinase [Orenia marismortui]|uniref:sensor histidine kinase n=1 Tax=Orenia marismortui TaxID=46469 RepID=UPI0003740C5F|nr:PAS domain-containing sensor histidine kinase [Orenia marismortui]
MVISSQEELLIDKEIITGLLESSRDGIIILDSSAKIIYKNQRFIEMYSFLEDISDQDDAYKLAKELKEKVNNCDKFISNIENRLELSTEYRDYLHFKDGRTWEVNFYPLLVNNQQKGQILNFRDISDCENLKLDIEIKDQAIENSLNAFSFIDLGGNILYANKRCLEMWGYELDQILGKNSIYFWDDREQLKDRIRTIVNQGSWYGEAVARRSDGSKFEVEVFSNLIRDDKGNPILLSATFIDISPRKEAERERIKSKQLYQKLIKLLPSAVFVHRNRQCLYANEAALELMGYDSLEEAIGRNFSELLNFKIDNYKDFEERLKDLEQEELSLGSNEYIVNFKDGRIMEVETISSSLVYNGERYITTVVQDISDRKETQRLQQEILKEQIKLEEAQEYDRLKTEFFSNISHDLKTPLNIILGVVELLMKSHKDNVNCPYYDQFTKYTNMMKQNCYRLLRLLNNLLDITRFDAGSMKLNLSNYNIVYLIEDIVMSIAPYAESQGIDLIFDTNVEERLIACDPSKIERVILNLLSNSFKFTAEEDRIEVKVIDQKESIAVCVKDTGMGIPEAELDKLFNRFEQVESDFDPKSIGSGVGLALVKSIVEAHNGYITVASNYREWTEFIIELPVRVISEDKQSKKIYNKAGIIERANIEFSDIYNKADL